MTRGKYGITKEWKIVWDDKKETMLKEKKRGEIFVKRGTEKRAGQAEMKKMHGG